MAQPSKTPFRIAMAAVVIVVVGFFALLVGNVVYHALHHSAKTPTAVSVTSLTVIDPSTLKISGTVTNLSDHTASITCLIGVLEPADPLAYPRRVTLTLAAGQTQTVTVTRSLLKPQAQSVRPQNIPFTCT
jgi:hypothetical protein